MSEPGGRGAGGRSSAARRAPRRGFEVYAPTSGPTAARRAAEAAKNAGAGAGGGGGGHDTTRGRALWEDERDAPRLPKGDREWKHDRWDEDNDSGGGGGGEDGHSERAAPAARGRGARRGAGAGGAAGGAQVPSEDKYEDMSRRVEEEVVAKLARAQMMGMMLKAHREQEQATDRRRGGGGGSGGGGRREGGGGGGGGGSSSSGRRTRGGGGGGDSSGSRQVLQRPRDAGKAEGGGSAGGGRHGSSQAAPASPAAAATSTRGAVVVGRDVRVDAPNQAPSGAGGAATARNARGSHQRAGLLKISPEQLSKGKKRAPPPPPPPAAVAAAAAANGLPEDLSADPDGMGLEGAYAAVGSLELQHKALLEKLRKEVGVSSTAARSSGAAKPSAASGTSAVDAAAAVARGSSDLPGAALYARVSRVRVVLSRALGSLVRRDPAFSLRKRLPNRLWMAHYRELEVIQQRLRRLLAGGGGRDNGGSGGGGGGGGTVAGAGTPQQRRQMQKQQQQALRARLFDLIEEAERDIGGMVDAVQQQIADAAESKASSASTPPGHANGDADSGSGTPGPGLKTHAAGGGSSVSGSEGNDGEIDSAGGGLAGSVSDSEEDDEENMSLAERGRRHALQAFLTSLADLSRYRGLHGGGGGGGSGGGSRAAWARAQELYVRALKVDPSSGKVWNQMAVLASSRQDNLEAFYAYLRGLCATVPHPAGRESLLILHEKGKARLSTLREATALDALGFEEHQARFRLYLLGACGTCLSRVDLGTFDGYLVLANRHMISCVQLHLMKGAETGPGSSRGSGGGGGGGGGTGIAVDPGGKGGLEGTLARAIVLSVCTVSASVEAWRSRGMEGGSWTEDAATSRAVRLCLSLAGSLAGLHRKTSRGGWERVTAAGVGVFLDWLTCRPQFGEGARGTGLEEFQHAMACVVEFANGIIRSASRGGGGGNGNGNDNAFSSAPRRRKNGGGGRGRGRGGGGTDVVDSEVDPDTILWEDEECRGIPAFATVAERRAAKERKRERVSRRDGRGRGPGEAKKRTGKESPDGGSGGGPDGSESWADDGGESSGSEGSAAPVDLWSVRVARIRRQVEFCVERGWVARGNRPGTYTLPKPPPRFGSSSPRRRDHSQGGTQADDGGDAFSAGQGVGNGVGGVGGYAGDDFPPPPAPEATGRKGRGVTGAAGTLWVAESSGGGGGGGGGGSTARPRARQQPRVPLVPPGQQRDFLSTPATAGPAKDALGGVGGGGGGVIAPGSNSPPFAGRGGGTIDAATSLSGFASAPALARQQQQQHDGDNAAAAATVTGAAGTNAMSETLSALHLEVPQPTTAASDPHASASPLATAAAAGVAPVDAGLRAPPGLEGWPAPAASADLRRQGDPLRASGKAMSPSGEIAAGGDGNPGAGTGDLLSVAHGLPPTGSAANNGGSADPLPESVLGIVLAGLGPAGDESHLCSYCCTALSPHAPECAICGTPAATAAGAAAAAAAAAAAIPECGWKEYHLAEDGRPYYSNGESSVWEKPKELEEYEAAVAAAAATAAAPAAARAAVPTALAPAAARGGGPALEGSSSAVAPAAWPGPSATGATLASCGEEEKKDSAAAGAAAVAGAGAGGALPAGVLAVGDLAEVMARSKPSLPGAITAASAAEVGGGGGRGARGGRLDAHNPAAIARTGLGDGGGGGGGRSSGASAVGAGGATMYGWPRGAPRSALPLVVIDVPNVAMRHGLNKKFSCKGVQMAIEYFRTAGHRVLGFLPDYYLDLKRTNGLERAKKLGVAEVRASRLPDDVQLLQRLVDDGLIISTPPQDYDDSYCIKYAMARDGYVVTNDLYRDHVKGINGRKKADAARRWIKTHSISYTFVGDEFFPNPDFSFHQDQQQAAGGGKGGKD